MLKISIVYNLFNFPPILIKFVSKFMVCNVLYLKAQFGLRLHSPLMNLGKVSQLFNTCPAELDMLCYCKQCRSRSTGSAELDLHCLSFSMRILCLSPGSSILIG